MYNKAEPTFRTSFVSLSLSHTSSESDNILGSKRILMLRGLAAEYRAIKNLFSAINTKFFQLQYITPYSSDVSEEHMASIFRLEE
jgi:hypothetical protein